MYMNLLRINIRGVRNLIILVRIKQLSSLDRYEHLSLVQTEIR
jgi:hypothetical protein